MFEFEYNGEVIKFQGYSNKFKAMSEANDMFGSLPEGAWFESSFQPGKFQWVEGNFFD